ncbi:hypothetical protein QCA50_007245 [Cerrena zonata]|uniref:Uncharacterized protein n=1 Tax=Cerrena zonata TaxID=2478898 RepID=A0AAW0G733_9APHY
MSSSNSPMNVIMRTTCLIAFAHTHHHSQERKALEREFYASSFPTYTPRWSREAPTAGACLARLSTPPPKTSINPFTRRKQSTLRQHCKASRVTAAPGVFETLMLKARRRTANKDRPRILHLHDGRRVSMDWLHLNIEPHDYTLIPLDKAQKRKNIVYRFQRDGQKSRVKMEGPPTDEWGRIGE